MIVIEFPLVTNAKESRLRAQLVATARRLIREGDNEAALIVDARLKTLDACERAFSPNTQTVETQQKKTAYRLPKANP